LDCRDCRDQLGAYAIGALSDEAAREVEAHLERCTGCRAEAAAYSEAASAVPLAAPALSAPGALRRRVLAPVLGDRQPARAAARWGPAWAAAGAAALVLVAAGLAWNVFLQLQVNDLDSTNDGLRAAVARRDEVTRQVLGLLAIDNASIDVMAGTGDDGWGLYAWDPAERLGHLVVDRLPSLPAASAYEFWYLTNEGPVSGGTVRTDLYGFAHVTTRPAREIERPTGYAVSIEPAGGSPEREGEIVLEGGGN